MQSSDSMYVAVCAGLINASNVLFLCRVLFPVVILVAAFAPVSRINSRSSLKMAFENEPGVIAPTGFWDPFGLANDIDDETFEKYRTAELKHGRVSMLAVTGLIAAQYIRFPGGLGYDFGLQFDDIPNGVGALSAIPAFGWFQIGASIGWWEIFGWKQVEGSTPGDFGFNSYGKLPDDPEKVNAMKTKELQNGRIAMIAIIELICHNAAAYDQPLFDLAFVRF